MVARSPTSALPSGKNVSPPCRVERPCTSALRVSTRAAELTDAFIISVDKAYTHLNVGTMNTIRRSKKEVERAAELVVRGGVGARGGYSRSRDQTAGSRVDVEETEPVPDSGTVSIARGISFRKKKERNLSSGFLHLNGSDFGYTRRETVFSHNHVYKTISDRSSTFQSQDFVAYRKPF